MNDKSIISVVGVNAMLCAAFDPSWTTETTKNRRTAYREYREDSSAIKCCDMNFVNGIEKCLDIMNENHMKEDMHYNITNYIRQKEEKAVLTACI